MTKQKPNAIPKEKWRDWLSLECTRYYFTMLLSEKDKYFDTLFSSTAHGAELTKDFYQTKGIIIGLEQASAMLSEYAKLSEEKEDSSQQKET